MRFLTCLALRAYNDHHQGEHGRHLATARDAADSGPMGRLLRRQGNTNALDAHDMASPATLDGSARTKESAHAGQQQGSGASGSEGYGTALRYAGHRRWTRQDSRAGGCENEGRTGRVDEPLYRGKHTSMVRVYKSARTDTDIAQTVEKDDIHA